MPRGAARAPPRLAGDGGRRSGAGALLVSSGDLVAFRRNRAGARAGSGPPGDRIDPIAGTIRGRLLAIAGGRPQPDLAPASLFLRKRHLKQRVVSILKEVGCLRRTWFLWLRQWAFSSRHAGWSPHVSLAAAPQIVVRWRRGLGQLGGATLMHRAPVDYPAAARAQGIQGMVLLQVKSTPAAAFPTRRSSGPDELRKTALASVLNWHFTNDAAGSTRQVSIAFQLPPAGAARAHSDQAAPIVAAGGTHGAKHFGDGHLPTAPAPMCFRACPVRQGDVLTATAESQQVESGDHQRRPALACQLRIPHSQGKAPPAFSPRPMWRLRLRRAPQPTRAGMVSSSASAATSRPES